MKKIIRIHDSELKTQSLKTLKKLLLKERPFKIFAIPNLPVSPEYPLPLSKSNYLVFPIKITINLTPKFN